MPAEYHDTAEFRGATFTSVDLAGATFRDCGFHGVKIVDSSLVDISLSGDVRHVTVDDVDVTEFVTAELDRRHPERVQFRTMQTAADYRAMWTTIERLWADIVERADQLPEPKRHERVDGEWSFVETTRHLVFATDAWAARTVSGEREPYHPLGLTQMGYPLEDAAAIGIDIAAQPSYDEVMAARLDRMAFVRRIVDTLTDDDLDRPCVHPGAPGYPENVPIGRCLRVVMNEEIEHRRYTVRDLAMLAGQRGALLPPAAT